MTNFTEYWIDYSAAKLDGNTVKAARWNGYPITGTIRYIDAPNLLRTKHTNKTEYDSLIRAGIKVRLVMQNTTKDADGGYAAGVANAQRAKAGADYLGYSGVIFFTNDRTEVPSPSTWQAYLDGAASVLGRDRVGAYGFKNALNYAVGHAAAFWQAGRESDLVGHANYYQWNNGSLTVGGITCDLNKVIRDYIPGYHPTNPEDAKMITPQALPYAPNEVTLAFPVESSGNSGIMEAVWFRIGNCWGGSCSYEVNFVNQSGQVVNPPGGDSNVGSGGIRPLSGTLENNQFAYWVLPADCTMIGLKYKNNSPENRAGISFPQKEK